MSEMNEGSFFLFSLKCTCVIIYALVMHSRVKTRSFISMAIKVTQTHCDNDDWSIPVKISTQTPPKKNRGLTMTSVRNSYVVFRSFPEFISSAHSPQNFLFVSVTIIKLQLLYFIGSCPLQSSPSVRFRRLRSSSPPLSFPSTSTLSRCISQPGNVRAALLPPPLLSPARQSHAPHTSLSSSSSHLTRELQSLSLLSNFPFPPSGNLNECTMKNRYPTQPPETSDVLL